MYEILFDFFPNQNLGKRVLSIQYILHLCSPVQSYESVDALAKLLYIPLRNEFSGKDNISQN